MEGGGWRVEGGGWREEGQDQAEHGLEARLRMHCLHEVDLLTPERESSLLTTYWSESTLKSR